MAQNLSCVLYNNLFCDEEWTYTGPTEAEGFEAENAFDWRDFSIFRASAGAAEIELTATAARTLDTIVVWCPAASQGGTTLTLAKQVAGAGAWATLATVAVVDTGKPVWTTFTAATLAATDKLKVSWTVASGTTDFRQIVVGSRLTMERGQWADMSPPQLTSGLVVDNVISVNGSIIGRNVKRQEKTGLITLDHLSQTWVRNSWEPFAAHAASRAFFWQWNPADYAAEIAFAVAESIVAPRNMHPPPKMHAEMPLRLISE